MHSLLSKFINAYQSPVFNLFLFLFLLTFNLITEYDVVFLVIFPIFDLDLEFRHRWDFGSFTTFS